MSCSRVLTILVILTLVLSVFSGCGDGSLPQSEISSTSEGQVSRIEATFEQDDSDMFTSRDVKTDIDEASGININLSGNTALCDSKKVVISNQKITITDDGVYILSGSLTDGSVIIDAKDTAKPQIVLKGVSVVSNDSAAIYVKNADKVFITLAEGTENILKNGGNFTAVDENNIDSVIFSKCDITLNGKGTLKVESPTGHGIAAKDDLVITGGKYVISSASHGFDVNDSVRISNADITVNSGKDGIHCENSEDTEKGFVYISSVNCNITSEGDGISASNYMQILDGSFRIVTGSGYENGNNKTHENPGQPGGQPGRQPGRQPGGRPDMQQNTLTNTANDDSSESIKGLKAEGSMFIEKGTFDINSADDALHSNLSVTVKGGNFDIKTGDDGIHADKSLLVSGGNVTIHNSYEGLEALDVTVSGGEVTITASDDGINAAGGTDQSGFGGGMGTDKFGGPGGPGGMSSGNGSIAISGGKINITASGDGIDANGTLEISGGEVTVTGPTYGDTATLDYDKTGVITGGIFIGTGARGMAQTFSSSSQGVVSVSASGTKGTRILLKDTKGNVLIDHSPSLDFAVVILSTPKMKSGEKYTLTVGNNTDTVTAS